METLTDHFNIITDIPEEYLNEPDEYKEGIMMGPVRAGRKHNYEHNKSTAGRLCANLCSKEFRCEHNGKIPLVRTTAKLDFGYQYYNLAHRKLPIYLKNTFGIDVNQAFLEYYVNDYYKKMNFHSTQMQDIKDPSYICMFSCYLFDNPDDCKPNRKFIIRNKRDINNRKEFILQHNSFVIFSTKTNKEYLHKINLIHDDTKSGFGTSWIGITFKLSKTIIDPKADLKLLSYDDEEELEESDRDMLTYYYKLRKEENHSIDFTWPELKYTLSPGDFDEYFIK